MWSLSLVALLGLGCAAAAQLSDAPTRQNFYRRGGAAATVIGNYVYFDGGEISQLLDGKVPSKQSYGSNSAVNSTLSIDISKSWTTSDVTFRTIDRPWWSKNNELVWTDDEAGIFYVWGGSWLRGRNMTVNELWKFTPDGNGGGTWALEPAANPELFQGLHQAEYGAFTNTKDTGFVVGGAASGWTELHRAHNQALPGMVAFNMKTKNWQNGTTGFSPYGTLATAGASAHFVPNFGPNGLIMLTGGMVHTIFGDPDWTTANAFDLRNLTFFDPVTNKAYWQITTGDIPPSPRSFSCLAGFQSSDSGYEIFLAGGRNHRDQFRYDDAYILSLPGFVWTKAPDSPAGRRQLSACVSVGKRQMLNIGGHNGSFGDQDPAPQGLLLFDMTEMKWKDSFNADAADYERAATIKTWYSDNSLDAVQWSSDEVRQMFKIKSTDPPSPSSTADPSTSATSEPQPQSGTPVGAIAGGVIGGVAGIAILAAVVWMLMRRRRNTDPDPDPGLEVDDNQNTHGGYYAADPSKQQWQQASPAHSRPPVPPSELTSEPEYAEIGGGAHNAYYMNPLLSQGTAVEMDATPAHERVHRGHF
ncbi:hypothetical protein C8A00DRAFT_18906 [Chaetomidium leptoderma]|uniref:Kelch repeat protein n=1 Tax=Chaetomidium leptoderma TaxID=669021 RepID=A0AAN6ZTE2_9PEZI|nr:hypothetical protein C8A00DRAFT_18906 [Chaetomidium leptoderma]